MERNKKKRIFAFHLPQFHPFPENNQFWGKGFTEWHNVTSAKPLFKNHYQPQLPTELGFYDLRLQASLLEQCELARNYGIDGFIFYHYWFNGKAVMDQPLQEYLKLSDKQPYFLCWANENWTRTWDGGENEILLKQDYNFEDDKKHLDYLKPFFVDANYLRINNKPVIAIYRPSHIPDLRNWVESIKGYAKEIGFDDLYFIYVVNAGKGINIDVEAYGFDSGFIFEPSWRQVAEGVVKTTFYDKLGKLLYILKLRKDIPAIYRNTLIDYPTYVRSKDRNLDHKKYFQCLFPSWDNTARRKNGGATIFINSSPGIFQHWFKEVYAKFQPISREENLIIINAWNEWAEGNHLEPCSKHGLQYLESVKAVVDTGHN